MATEATVSRQTGYSRAEVKQHLQYRRKRAAVEHLVDEGIERYQAEAVRRLRARVLAEDVQDGEPGVLSYGLRAPSGAVPLGAEVSI